MPDDLSLRNSSKEQKNLHHITLLLLAVYGLLATIMTWPAAARLSTDLAGGRSDLWIHQWTFWWIKEALQSGQNPFFTTQLYYPLGVSLTSHNIAWLNIAAWLPLQALVGATAAYNLIIIAIFTLNGFVFYLFARELTASQPASFIGGLVFGFWPYTMSHYDHPNMIILFWVPLTMLLLHRTYKRQTPLYALLAALSLALIGISRWQLLVMSAPLLVAYVLFLWLSDDGNRSRRAIGLYLLTAVGAALLMAPLAAPLVRDQLSRDNAADVAVSEPEGVTDLLSYVIPPAIYNHFWRDRTFRLIFEEPYENIAASFNYVPFIGYLTLILALYGAIRQWSKAWIWALLALVYFVMALGPTLTIDAQRLTQFPLPYRLIGDTLIDVLIRRPHRLNLFLSLPVAMLVSWGVLDLIQLLRRRFSRRGRTISALVIISIGLVILWENPIRPYPTTSTEIPQWYRELADEPGRFGILELPTYERGFDKLYMFYQTRHGKPISGGHVSRLPADVDAFRESIPFLRPLLRQDSWLVQPEEWVDFAEVDVTRQFRALAAAGIRYVIVHKTLLEPGILERWRDWVTLSPFYEDEVVLVYRTQPEAGREILADQLLADGIGLIRTSVHPFEANQGGTIKVDVRWATEGAPTADHPVCFSLRHAQQGIADVQCMEIAVGFPTSQWAANEVVRGSYLLPLSEDIWPGDYELEMFLATDGQIPVGETAVLGNVHIHAVQPQTLTDACWTEKFCLKGYDTWQHQGLLELVTYWQTRQALPDSYKLFVHLADAATGKVVAQSDAIPRNWSYPTDIWEPGEIVRDSVSLSLESVAPGQYAVLLGWYNVKNGERLLVCPTGACDQETAEVYQLTTIDVAGH